MLPLGYFYSNFIQIFVYSKAADKKKINSEIPQGGILAPSKTIWLYK